MRHRSRSLPDVTGFCNARYLHNGEPVYPDTHVEILSYRQIEDMWDVVTPHFHSRVRAGEIFNNPLIVTKEEITEAPVNGGTYVVTSDPSYVLYYDDGYWTGYFLGSTGPNNLSPWSPDIVSFDTEIQDAIHLAKMRAVEAIDRTPYAFMEDLAELTATMRTLGNPLASANAAASRFQRRTRERVGFYMKRRKLQRAEATVKAASDAWLSSRYEFRPIMISLSNIMSGLPKIHTRPKRMKARASQDVAFSKAGTLPTSFSNVSSSVQLDKRFKVKAWIDYTMVQNHDYRDWDLGLRLKDVPATAWALVPMSFVVDRFVDISSAIKGITNLADPRLNILGGGVIMTSYERVAYTAHHDAPSGWSGGSFSGSQRTVTRKGVRRESWTPTYADTLPTWTGQKAVSDLSNILDMSALVAKKLRFPH